MRKYIPTHFVPQASAIEIYYRIQSKIHKAEETARLWKGLKPEVSLPEYMHYKNTVGRFLHPDLGTQKLVAQKTNPLQKGWEKCVLEKNLGNPQKKALKSKKLFLSQT
jgi:hypothetical protein